MSELKVRPAESASHDWFLPAILSNGGVQECLNEVVRAEELKLQFLAALQTSLCAYRGRSTDSLSELKRRVVKLEETLDFRVGMLSPERRGAWFRESLKQKTGPFPASILSEPVFMQYELEQAELVRRAIQQSWEQRKVLALPFSQKGPCLWLTLLELNCAYEEICVLQKPFGKLRLDVLPTDLPPALETAALDAFLNNVRKTALEVRERLDAAYARLWEPCTRFWTYQTSLLRQKQSRDTHYHKTADDIRSQFRERRQQQATRAGGVDLMALKFMQFDDYPTKDELRKRYLTLARQMHPDCPGGNEEQFKMLTKAYKQLEDKVKGAGVAGGGNEVDV